MKTINHIMVKEILRSIEDKAISKNLPIRHFLIKANINRSTWYRWKHGQMPSMRLLSKLDRTINKHI